MNKWPHKYRHLIDAGVAVLIAWGVVRIFEAMFRWLETRP